MIEGEELWYNNPSQRLRILDACVQVSIDIGWINNHESEGQSPKRRMVV